MSPPFESPLAPFGSISVQHVLESHPISVSTLDPSSPPVPPPVTQVYARKRFKHKRTDANFRPQLPSPATMDPHALHQSGRIQARTKKSTFAFITSYSPVFRDSLEAIHIVPESLSFREAVQFPKWQQTVQEL